MTVRSLARKWNTWQPVDLPQELESQLQAWRDSLTDARGVEYLAAINGFVLRMLLDGIVLQGKEEPSGRIITGKVPHLFVKVYRGSPLAERMDLPAGGEMTISSAMFAHHIGLRCNVMMPWGALAWHFFVASLPQAAELFPELRILPSADGSGSFSVERIPGKR